MEISLIGLQNAGKTSLVNVIAVCKCNQPTGQLIFCIISSFPKNTDAEICLILLKTGGYSEDMIPTVCYLSLTIKLVTLQLEDDILLEDGYLASLKLTWKFLFSSIGRI